ncbi:hypothetical protein N656DRAFT_74050 [Canariomyces notabilis]|uniref:Uncharacterized protein n=1 Tax=Canariomyces notabilis TaxID=2074819 RepID=A0AAN6TE68_9PEZI|nr:hypothetical protein N656DRAFT_74050 [Canariomyces arenarius]
MVPGWKGRRGLKWRRSRIGSHPHQSGARASPAQAVSANASSPPQISQVASPQKNRHPAATVLRAATAWQPARPRQTAGADQPSTAASHFEASGICNACMHRTITKCITISGVFCLGAGKRFSGRFSYGSPDASNT